MALEALGNVGGHQCIHTFAPRQKQPPKRPWVLDETLPKAEDPLKKITKEFEAQQLEKAKKKPDSERNYYDYYLLFMDALKNNPLITGMPKY